MLVELPGLAASGPMGEGCRRIGTLGPWLSPESLCSAAGRWIFATEDGNRWTGRGSILMRSRPMSSQPGNRSHRDGMAEQASAEADISGAAGRRNDQLYGADAESRGAGGFLFRGREQRQRSEDCERPVASPAPIGSCSSAAICASTALRATEKAPGKGRLILSWVANNYDPGGGGGRATPWMPSRAH